MLYAKEKKEILAVLAPNNAPSDVFSACRALCQEGRSEHALLVALFAKLPEPKISELLTYVSSFPCRFPLGPVRPEKVTESRDTNWNAGTCQVCGQEVGARLGGIVHDGRSWKVVCASAHCHDHLGVTMAPRKTKQAPEVFLPEGEDHFAIALTYGTHRFVEQKEFVHRELGGTWRRSRRVWIVRASALEVQGAWQRAATLGLRCDESGENVPRETYEAFKQRRLAWLLELGRVLATQYEKDIERVQIEYEDYIDKTLESQRRRSAAYPELEMTEPVRELVHQAAIFMLEQCDGAIHRDDVGFSRADANMARHLFRRFREDARIDRALERMLARYHRQLGEAFPELFRTQLDLCA